MVLLSTFPRLMVDLFYEKMCFTNFSFDF